MTYTVTIDGQAVSISQLNIVTTVDKTLDYGSFIVRNEVSTAYDVGTPVDIDVTDGTTTINYHFVIQADDMETIKGGKYIHSIDIIELTKILEWHTESIRTFTQVVGGQRLTMLDILIRLQNSIPLERSEDVGTTRIFAIDTDLGNQLRVIEAPEFVFANKNLKEILIELFDFIGAVPRLIKQSGNIILVADYYNKRRNLVTENTFSRMERFNINEFGTALDIDIRNLYDSYTQVVEPAPNTYKRLYAEGGDFTEDNLIIKTDYPIVDIVSLKVKTDILPKGISNINNPNATILTGIEIDLTPCILERSLWENLTNAGFTGNFETGTYRDNTLFFNRFSQDITNLYDVVGAFSNAPIVAGTERIEAVISRALVINNMKYSVGGELVDLRFGEITNYAEIEFQITYKAQIDSRTEIKRLDTRRVKYESQAYTGQTDNVVRADRVLDKLFKTQQLLGNAEVMTGERTKDLSELYELGDYTTNDYILTTAEFQFEKQYVTAKYLWTQNFQKVSEFIGLNSAIRLFPIPNDTYQRNVYIEDVIEVSTTTADNESDITADGILTFMNTLNNQPSATYNKPITNIAFDNPSVPSYDTNDNIIVKPVSGYAGGNAINFHFEFDNPSVAGWQVDVDSQSGSQTLSFADIDEEDPEAPGFWQVVGSIARAGWDLFLKTDTVGTTTAVSYKAAQEAEVKGNTITTVFKKPIVNGVYYVDNNGTVSEFSFHLTNGYTVSNAGNLPIVAKEDLATKLVSTDKYLVYKDAREEFAMTYAIHVLPAPNFEKTFIVGKYLVERNNLLKSIAIANNQFEVFTATSPYDINENQISRTSDQPINRTYTISGNRIQLNGGAIAPNTTWGIRKIDTKELVIVVNQGATSILSIFFNFKDKKSGIVYPSQTRTILPPVLRPASFQVVPPLPTSSVVNLSWQETNDPASDDFELGYSSNLLDWETETVTGNTKQVTGLDPLTKYTFRIRARIGTEYSEYVYVETTTLAPIPPAPQNVVATLSGERRIILRWDEVDGAFLYRIEISESSSFDTLISEGIKQAFTNYAIIDWINTDGIDYDTTYYIRIRALRGGVFGEYSTTVTIATLEGPITSAPLITNLTFDGTTVSYRLINTDNRLVTLFSDFTDATTQRATNVRPNEGITVTGTPSNSQTTIFAKATTPLKLNSEVVSADFAATNPPSAPSISAVGIVVQPGYNRVNWSYSGELVDGFVVERNPNEFNSAQFGEVSPALPPTARGWTDYSINSGQSYTYRVKAYNRAGDATSNEQTVTSANAAPTAPSNLVLVAVLAGDPGQGFVSIQWQRNSNDEDGFLVQRKLSTQGAGSWVDVGGTPKAQTNFGETVEGPSNTNYDYRIIAYNEFGNSSPSNILTVNIA